MSCVVCCAVRSVVCRLYVVRVSVVRCFIVFRFSFAVRCLFFVVCCLLIVCRFVGCCLLFVVYGLLFVVCVHVRRSFLVVSIPRNPALAVCVCVLLFGQVTAVCGKTITPPKHRARTGLDGIVASAIVRCQERAAHGLDYIHQQLLSPLQSAIIIITSTSASITMSV